MSDKIKLIKEEIEKELTVLDKTSVYDTGRASELNHLLLFIDSLPEEPESDDLDYLVISLEETIGTSPHSREVIKEHLQKAAEWQKQNMKEALQTKYEKGLYDMREEMMKNAVDAIFIQDYAYKTPVLYGDLKYKMNIVSGQPIKLYQIKKEQQ